MTQSALAIFTDKELLNMKVKDLPLDDKAFPYPRLIKKLSADLKRRGIIWTPHVWASEEWFSPDGVPGFAFPFTLLDSRLAQLEKKHVGFVEGSTEKESLKLIRHECGHAIDNAFHLRKNKRRQVVFGKSSIPYPNYYLPTPHSKNFVRHLSHNYAQAHPEEDWAETFAVWLSPKKDWKKKYQKWKALKKLSLMDEIMSGLQNASPKVKNLKQPLHFREDERSLREYFEWRKASLGLRRKNFYEKKISGIFTKSRKTSSASDLFPQYEKEICKTVSRQTHLARHVVKNMVKELKLECKAKNYQLKSSKRRTKKEIEELISRHSLEYLKKKRHRIYM